MRTQWQSATLLCRSCGAEEVPVERDGKMGHKLIAVLFSGLGVVKFRALCPDGSARIAHTVPYNNADDCASPRDAAHETS